MTQSPPESREAALRLAEWIGVGLALFLLSGAIFPLRAMGADNVLDEAERAGLRILQLPVYLLTLALAARHSSQVFVAVVRNLPMAALLALCVASVFWSVSGSITGRRVIALLMTMLLAYVIAIRFTPRQQLLLFGGVLGLCTGLSLAAGAVMPGTAYAPGDGALRGVFLHKNVVGWTGIFTFVLGIAGIHDHARKVRRASWVLAVMGLVGVLASTSVTSLFGATVGAGLLVVVKSIMRHRGFRRMVLTLILLELAAVLLIALSLYLVPLLDALGKDSTLTGRVPLWETVDTKIAARPVLGYGYGAFWTDGNLAAWEIWSQLQWKAPHAHNGYRDLLLNFGVIGVGVFYVVIAKAVRQGIALCTRDPSGGWLWPMLAIGVTLVLNLSETTFLVQNDLLWLLCATGILSISFRHGAETVERPRHVRVAAAAA
ncbi:exopolysaccharide production protein ExoQ [Tranquillimonas rosea]|uniref:Exopolysaccharide production protein ExoQ n=1 Tax=Tranquillimonas rosea TaxID=641238 RepID=A0A1H9X2U4_9RHOB|nr:O-antigen ligase [Tranquillimonas rosea]SES40435.1 exopolysaccharide production protein ExoQ [Tranquillimonas rosea]